MKLTMSSKHKTMFCRVDYLSCHNYDKVREQMRCKPFGDQTIDYKKLKLPRIISSVNGLIEQHLYEKLQLENLLIG